MIRQNNKWEREIEQKSGGKRERNRPRKWKRKNRKERERGRKKNRKKLKERKKGNREREGKERLVGGDSKSAKC